MIDDPIIFSIFLIFTGAAVLAGIALFARQSLLVAYILLGGIVGPWGLKLVNENLGPLMTRIGFDAGLLAIFANNDPSVVQILPPLIIQEEEVMEVLGILDGMLAGLESFVS